MKLVVTTNRKTSQWTETG